MASNEELVCTLECRETLWTRRIPDLSCYSIILIASDVRVLACMADERSKKDQTPVLAGCHFAIYTLELLVCNVGHFVGSGNARKYRKSASQCVAILFSRYSYIGTHYRLSLVVVAPRV